MDHDWREYDERHKACARCGLRLFYTEGAYGQRGWLCVDYNGITSPPMLTAASGFGTCDPPPAPPIRETVIIEYTGDPDRHPSCERYMHRMPGGDSTAIVDLRSLRPVCGWISQWWELGPAREHVGWTWCGWCFPGWGPPRSYEHELEPPEAYFVRKNPPRLPPPDPRRLK